MKQINKKKKAGFTLVEIIVVCGLIGFIAGGAILMFRTFRQSYSKGEGTAVLLQEGVLLVANIRNDLNNAIIPPGTNAQNFFSHLRADKNQLKFSIYDNYTGKSQPVVYTYTFLDVDKGSISRKIGNKSIKTIIAKNVASINWKLNFEKFSGLASGTSRLYVGIELHLKNHLQGHEKENFTYKTKVFPVRLNRQLNLN